MSFIMEDGEGTGQKLTGNPILKSCHQNNRAQAQGRGLGPW